MKVLNPYRYKVDMKDFKAACAQKFGFFRQKSIIPISSSRVYGITHHAGRIYYVHRLLYEYWYPYVSMDGMHVCYKDGNPKNLQKSNLTLADPVDHSVQSGRAGRGKFRKETPVKKIRSAMAKHNNVLTKAAKDLGISVVSLRSRIEYFKLTFPIRFVNKIKCKFDEKTLAAAVKSRTRKVRNVYHIFGRGHHRLYPNIAIDGKHYLVHRVIMEYVLGRKLKIDEIVHHKDGDVLNARKNNLQILTRAQHALHHSSKKKRSSPCT